MLSVLGFVPALLYLFMLEQLCLQSKSSDNLAVNHSTEEIICASGRLPSYLYPSCSAGMINLYAKVGIYYTHNNSNEIFEWAKYHSNAG